MDFGLGGRSHGSNSPTVEGLVEGDDIVAPGGLPKSPCEFDEPIIRFRSGVGEEDLARMSDDLFHNELSKVSLLLDVVEIGTMHQSFRLFRDGLCQGGVAMPQRANRDT